MTKKKAVKKKTVRRARKAKPLAGQQDDYEGCFGLAQEDDARALHLAKAEVREALGVTRLAKSVSVSVAFCEFDSGNASHANACWDVTITTTSPKMRDRLADSYAIHSGED